MRTFFVLVLLWMLVLLLPSRIIALESTFGVTSDTYVKPAANEPYGYEPTLLIERNVPESWTSYVFLLFETIGLPDGSIIDDATLRMNVTDADVNGCSIQAQRQGSGWNEDVTYFTLGYQNTSTIYDITYAVGTGAYQWDLTQLVKDWRSGTYSNYGVVLFSTETCRKLFASRQNSDSAVRPRLVVAYHLTPTATPTSTPSPSPIPTAKPSATPTPTVTLKPSVSPTTTPRISPSPSPQLLPGLLVSQTPSPTPAALGGQEPKEKSGDLLNFVILLFGVGFFVTAIAAYLIWSKKIKLFNKGPSSTPASEIEATDS
ncbi:DNRLRE domain-containing protein [Candidatus Woesebacteria bacterium]|nr:DNRLRE domain-containing protein [Candidatus Woesebacteria bacterium]